MKIDVITIFPQIFDSVFDYGILGNAIKSENIEIKIHDLRNWSKNNHKQIDDRPFGGGAGMIFMPEPLAEALNALKTENSKTVFLTPTGSTLNQQKVEEFSQMDHLIIICGRYEGIDHRIIEKYVDIQISIGDYVLSGGEIPAMVLIDSITRLLPGSIKNTEFNKDESFSHNDDRNKLDYPQYTRPEEFEGNKVPDVLLSGNHKEIENWRNQNRYKKDE